MFFTKTKHFTQFFFLLLFFLGTSPYFQTTAHSFIHKHAIEHSHSHGHGHVQHSHYQKHTHVPQSSQNSNSDQHHLDTPYISLDSGLPQLAVSSLKIQIKPCLALIAKILNSTTPNRIFISYSLSERHHSFIFSYHYLKTAPPLILS